MVQQLEQKDAILQHAEEPRVRLEEEHKAAIERLEKERDDALQNLAALATG
jgi:hypothetical protein